MVNREQVMQDYGRTLEEIEAKIGEAINQYFIDEDGFIMCCVNTRTLLPFADDDPEVNLKPVDENWIARGGFPNDLKKTYLTYEDSDMAAGDYLMALMARGGKTLVPQDNGEQARDVTEETRAFFKAMVKLYDTVAEKNPYGAGFLPKPYGGIGRAHDSFEMSADQYLKFTAALEKYSSLTHDEEEKSKVSEILLSFATWLDDRDFVTPYMGYCNYGRLQWRMHYTGYFAYIMALGYKISGNDHFLEEALFFKDKMLTEGRVSPAPNSLNLVVESCDRLIELMPDYRKDWLDLMARDWENRLAYMEDDNVAHFSGYRWNCGARQASTYNTIVKHMPERAGDLDLRSLLLRLNTMASFVHQLSADDPDDATYPEHAFALLSQSYACWLRGYWESDLSSSPKE